MFCGSTVNCLELRKHCKNKKKKGWVGLSRSHNSRRILIARCCWNGQGVPIPFFLGTPCICGIFAALHRLTQKPSVSFKELESRPRSKQCLALNLAICPVTLSAPGCWGTKMFFPDPGLLLLSTVAWFFEGGGGRWAPVSRNGSFRLTRLWKSEPLLLRGQGSEPNAPIKH